MCVRACVRACMRACMRVCVLCVFFIYFLNDFCHFSDDVHADIYNNFNKFLSFANCAYYLLNSFKLRRYVTYANHDKANRFDKDNTDVFENVTEVVE